MTVTMNSHRTFTFPLLVLALLAAGARPASAQIVNSLTGFSETEPGWSGTLQTLFTISRGNSDYLDWSAGATAQVQGPRQRVRFLAGWDRRSAEGTTLADNELLHLRHNYRFADRWRTIVFAQYQRDPFRRIARRNLAGGGLRYDLRRRYETGDDGTKDMVGMVALGATLMHEGEEWTDDDQGSRNGERLSFFVSAFGKLSRGVSLDASAFYQPRPGDFGNSRALGALSLNAELVGSLRLIVRYDLVHDSMPPEGVAPTDYRLRSGLAFGL